MPYDTLDATARAEDIGKPVGQEAAHVRQNAVRALGLAGAAVRLDQLAHDAVESVLDYPGGGPLRTHILSEISRLLPPELAILAAQISGPELEFAVSTNFKTGTLANQ